MLVPQGYDLKHLSQSGLLTVDPPLSMLMAKKNNFISLLTYR
ncbi:hypothetical protein [uncultured Virgibacillus sp.]|nr:hypothetical protein [uncultured Virgibacillus sp.]